MSKDEFEKQIRKNKFAEWAMVHGNYYGTSKEVISSAAEQGKTVLLDIDVQGAASLRNLYSKSCLMVFITPPSLMELGKRLKARGTDNEQAIEKRLKNAASEMGRTSEFDHVIINDSLERAYEELKKLVKKHLLRPATDLNG
mgnify:CR=1 FL=1